MCRRHDHAATINISRTEVGASVNYLVGFGPFTSEDDKTVTSDGIDPAIAQLGGLIEGYYPTASEYSSAQIDLTSSASLAYDRGFGSIAPSIYGSLSSSIMFSLMVNRGVSYGEAPASDNFVAYEFEVIGGPVDYSLSYNSDLFGFLRINIFGGPRVLNMAATGQQNGTLQAGAYSLLMFHNLDATETDGNRNGNSDFAMTFDDSVTIIGPSTVPLPAGVLLFGSGLLALVGWRRVQGRTSRT